MRFPPFDILSVGLTEYPRLEQRMHYPYGGRKEKAIWLLL
jgi:hypothetical protein